MASMPILDHLTIRLSHLSLSQVFLFGSILLLFGIPLGWRLYLACREYLYGTAHDGTPRPPLVPYWIPFVGSAISISKGDKFWDDVAKKYGPVARIVAVGQERIFVQSPFLITHIYKVSKSFDFPHLRKSLQVSVFGMSYDSSFSETMVNQLFPAHHRNLQPGMIGQTIGRYTEHLERLLKERLDSLPEKGEVDLVDTVYDILYTASSKAFFSSSFPSTTTKAKFLKFDSLFPLLSLETLPGLFRSPALQIRDDLVKLIVEWYATTTPADQAEMAPNIMAMRDSVDVAGWSEWDWGTLLLADLWALEANAPFAGAWTIAEIARRPALLSLLRTEISQILPQLTPPTLSTLLRLPQPELVASLPLINACFQETLRFHTSSYSIRRVTEDVILPPVPTSGGTARVQDPRGYSIKAGEEVVCVTRSKQISPGSDMEDGWGEDADVWDHTRWFKDGSGGRGSAKAKGYMWPFGGGTSMCEGRHFASAEILTFIAAFISLANIEIVSDSMAHDPQRQGLGVMQPKGKMTVKLSRGS